MASSNDDNDNAALVPNEMDVTIVENDDEESDASSEFNFASALALRKNLTQAFDQQVHSSSVTQKIAHLEQRAAAAAANHDNNNGGMKPPRQQPQKKGSKKARCLSVYLRVRPIPVTSSTSTEAVTNTVEVMESSSKNEIPTTIRTYPPLDSNAAKVLRQGSSDASLSLAGGENNNKAGGVKEFKFQQVFEPDTSQLDLYTSVAAPMVQGLFPPTNDKSRLVGESALLFAYGITNSGKTHTVMGNFSKKKSQAAPATPFTKWGIVPRALHDVFAIMESDKKHKFNVHLSYLEIYNENIHDLLPKEKSAKARPYMAPDPLKLREGPQGDVFVRGLAKHRVRSVQHGLELAERAQTKRHTSSNNLNVDSSRSHCICQVELSAVTDMDPTMFVKDDNESVASLSGYNTDEEAAHISGRKGKTVTLWIVDLAGSERSKRTGFGAGLRQKESSVINASLMKLMRCLAAMRGKQEHRSRDIIPYRESKLTHLFMNHLSGKSASRTCMIVNVNPASCDYDETQHILSYAVAAKSVQITQQDYMDKKKAINGIQDMEATHDYDGRPLKKARTNAATKIPRPNKISKLVKRFSPKKLSPKKMLSRKRDGSKKMKPTADAVKKRKADLVGMRGTALSSNNSDGPRTKVARLGEKAEMKKAAVSQKPAAKSTAHNHEKEIKSLEASLLIARAEAEVIKSQNQKLENELSLIEEQVRMEVAEETEEQMRAMREQYNNTINRLKVQIQSNPTPARSVRKARTDKAEQMIEELMDKVEECEEEMVRMREQHESEVSRLQQKHNELAQAEISKVKESCEAQLQRQGAEMKHLVAKVKALEEENDTLKKQAVENAKPRVPLGQINNDVENLPEYNSVKNSTNKKKKTGGAGSRAPLSVVSSNANNKSMKEEDPIADLSEVDTSSSEDEEDNDELLYPKRRTAKDEDGAYQRPRGRAPSGREWDSRKGAWRLSIA